MYTPFFMNTTKIPLCKLFEVLTGTELNIGLSPEHEARVSVSGWVATDPTETVPVDPVCEVIFERRPKRGGELPEDVLQICTKDGVYVLTSVAEMSNPETYSDRVLVEWEGDYATSDNDGVLHIFDKYDSKAGWTLSKSL